MNLQEILNRKKRKAEGVAEGKSELSIISSIISSSSIPNKGQSELSSTSIISPYEQPIYKTPEEIKDKEYYNKALLTFFILHSKFYSRDLRIGYGDAFIAFLEFLTEGHEYKIEDYINTNETHSEKFLTIRFLYTYQMVYKIDPKIPLFLYQRFLEEKKIP